MPKLEISGLNLIKIENDVNWNICRYTGEYILRICGGYCINI